MCEHKTGQQHGFNLHHGHTAARFVVFTRGRLLLVVWFPAIGPTLARDMRSHLWATHAHTNTVRLKSFSFLLACMPTFLPSPSNGRIFTQSWTLVHPQLGASKTCERTRQEDCVGWSKYMWCVDQRVNESQQQHAATNNMKHLFSHILSGPHAPEYSVFGGCIWRGSSGMALMRMEQCSQHGPT